MKRDPRRSVYPRPIRRMYVPAVPELLDKRLVIVTGKGGVGKSTVALALGLAAAARGPANDRLRGLLAGAHLPGLPPGRGRLPRGRDGGQPVGDLDRPRRGDARVRPASAQGPGDARPAVPLPDLHLPRGGHPGPARAGDDREDLGGRPAGPQGEEGAQVRPRDRRRAGDRRRASRFLQTPRTFANIARVGPIKAQAEALEAFIVNHRKTGVAIVALPEEMPVNETVALERQLTEEVGRRGGSRLHERALPGALLRSRSWSGSRRACAKANGPLRAACRAALSESRRAAAQREQLARLAELVTRAGANAAVRLRARARRRGDPRARQAVG